MADAAQKKDAAVPSTTAAPIDRNKLKAVNAFLESFVKGAKTIALYKEGHEMIGQIVSRVNNLLRTALGREPNLTIRVKSKNIYFEEATIEETEEMISFAATMHVLGIGQVMFSGKLQDEGMMKFMRILTERPDVKRSLIDMQKEIQQTRIDGLQLVSIMSFVETDDSVEQMTPGHLTEEEVQDVVAAATLPDFLFLLFHQNEPLTGKQADKLTVLFDEVMDRSISLDDFAGRMPWDLYDPRVRQRWDQLLQDIAGRTKWTRAALCSDLSVMTAADKAFKENEKPLEAAAAFGYALAYVHTVLAKPAGDKQPKYALFAYTRLLGSMALRGELQGLLKEVEIWRSMAADAKWAAYLAALRKEVQAQIPQAALAKNLVAALKEVEPESPGFQTLNDFVLTIGHGIVPLLLADLKEVGDKAHRQKVCALLAAVCRRLGPDDLFAALGDEDYFQVVLVVGILNEINMPGSAEKVAPLLQHSHAKVRQAVFQALRRFGGDASVSGMANFIVTHNDENEVKLAVTSLSLINHPKVGQKLVEAYMANENTAVRVALVTALGRFGTTDTLNFLQSLDHWGWLDWATGKNKELRIAVRASILQVKKELEDGAAN
ncbi:MAG: HEAT repeat domain-containing protein [Elusimicrobiota bacterium]